MQPILPETWSLIKMTWDYVQSAPLFWTGMGSLTAIAMFIGAMLYDGQLKAVMKLMVAILPYTLITILLGIVRKNDALLATGVPENPQYIYASTITIFATTAAYFTGMVLGVCVFFTKYRHKEHC